MKHIDKIVKAKFYADEPNRITFDAFTARIRDDSDVEHQVEYDNGSWQCECEFFNLRGFCSHIMALERILGKLISMQEEDVHQVRTVSQEQDESAENMTIEPEVLSTP